MGIACRKLMCRLSSLGGPEAYLQPPPPFRNKMKYPFDDMHFGSHLTHDKHNNTEENHGKNTFAFFNSFFILQIKMCKHVPTMHNGRYTRLIISRNVPQNKFAFRIKSGSAI